MQFITQFHSSVIWSLLSLNITGQLNDNILYQVGDDFGVNWKDYFVLASETELL